MVVFRSLKALINESNTRGRTFLTLTTTTTSSFSPLNAPLSNPLFRLPSSNGSHRFLSPFSKWVIPFQHGPLFLACPPWKLSQSATPLNGIVRRQAFNLNLNLLRARTRFPLKLLDRVDSNANESSEHGLLDSFVNVPNCISFGRLISGPVLGWYVHFFFYSEVLFLVDGNMELQEKGMSFVLSTT